MKIKVTLMTENDKHLDMSKEDIEESAKQAWELACMVLNMNVPEGEKVSVEKCELIEK